MFLSIIIPTRNRSDSLAKALSALTAEVCHAADAEIIVVDDDSIPEYKKENGNLCAHLNVRYIAHEKRRGAAAARNTGIKNSTGTWIAFLDDDVRVCKDWYGMLLEKLGSLPPDVVGMEGRVDAEGSGLWDREVTNENGGLFLTCHCAYRADVLKEENGFDEHFSGRYPSCEDHDLAARMLHRGKVVFEKDIYVVHAGRRMRLVSYCAVSFERMKSQLEAEFYFYVKQRDRYHQFRHYPDFFGTLGAVLFKHTITTLLRRSATGLLRHPLQCTALIVSCLLEEACAWVLMPVFIFRFVAGQAMFFPDAIDLQRTRELWNGNARLSITDFLLKRSIPRSLSFRFMRRPVYSAVPVLRHLRKKNLRPTGAARCFLRIDDMFLDRTQDIEALCGILREAKVPFLASVTGDHLCDRRYDRGVETILSSGGELGLHGFCHKGTFGPFASELLQLTYGEITAAIERVMERLPAGIRRLPLAFVPPFNAISRAQIYHAGTYFPIVCGGPETARFTDGLFGPLALKNGSWYFPSYFPFYSTAAALVRSKAPETLKRVSGIACVTLHMPEESKNGFADVKRLIQGLSETAVSWTRLTI
jgi:glycosyltransferase involved in cell wall biosynthesis